jgi:hypothetical protein
LLLLHFCFCCCCIAAFAAVAAAAFAAVAAAAFAAVAATAVAVHISAATDIAAGAAAVSYSFLLSLLLSLLQLLLIPFLLQLGDLDTSVVTGEVNSLATSLDMLKLEAENVIKAYKHASNKQLHPDRPEEDSYDPALAHFLEEKFVEPYTSEIRDMAGRLNLLAKMARNDNTRAMGLHLFDQSLK